MLKTPLLFEGLGAADIPGSGAWRLEPTKMVVSPSVTPAKAGA